jgi:16S rRNA (guanine(1405)-N(7))-methyltransferase
MLREYSGGDVDININGSSTDGGGHINGVGIYSDREFAVRIMGLHASTSERAGQIREIFDALNRHFEPGDAIIDIGCGFNPFCLPFFNPTPESYYAYDVSGPTVDLINMYFGSPGGAYMSKPLSVAYNSKQLNAAHITKPPGGAYIAKQLDAASQSPDCHAPRSKTVVFMFKIIPLLEHQKKGRAFELLASMEYRAAIVSFPTKTASGRERGMEAFYSDMFAQKLPAGLKIAEKAMFGNEMFFIVNR